MEVSQLSNTSQADQAAELQTADQSSAAVTTHMQYVKNTSGTVFWPVTSWDAIIGLDAYLTNADVIKNIQQNVDHIAKAGDAAVINIVTQAQYDALTDKSGVYFIEG